MPLKRKPWVPARLLYCPTIWPVSLMPNGSVALVKIPGWLRVLKIWIGMLSPSWSRTSSALPCRYPRSSHHPRRPWMLTKKLDQGDKLILDDDLDAFLGDPSLPPTS